MKILLATDGSSHSKAMVKKFSGRTFAPNTKVRIISAYERTSYMMNTAPMGALSEYYAEADQSALKSAENATENAVTTLRKKNPKLSISTIAIEGSPRALFLKKLKNSVLI